MSISCQIECESKFTSGRSRSGWSLGKPFFDIERTVGIYRHLNETEAQSVERPFLYEGSQVLICHAYAFFPQWPIGAIASKGSDNEWLNEFAGPIRHRRWPSL